MGSTETYLTKEQLIDSFNDYIKDKKTWNQIYSLIGSESNPESALKILTDQKMIRKSTGKQFNKMYDENIELKKANEELVDNANNITERYNFMTSMVEFYRTRSLWDRIINKKPYTHTQVN